MKILGIESSCDETAASIIEGDGDSVKVLSNIVSSQIDIHKKYGGVIPEIAAREHVLDILPVVDAAIKEARAAGLGDGDVEKMLEDLKKAYQDGTGEDLNAIVADHIAGNGSDADLDNDDDGDLDNDDEGDLDDDDDGDLDDDDDGDLDDDDDGGVFDDNGSDDDDGDDGGGDDDGGDDDGGDDDGGDDDGDDD